MAQAWYEPHAFSPIPLPKRAGDDDDDDDGEGEEDEEGQRTSVEYIWSLVEKEVERGVHPSRIVVGGFSQGAATSLLLGLGLGGKEKPGRAVRGIVGLSGYLPWSRGIREEVGGAMESGGGGEMRFFLAHGTRDQLVPMRIFRQARETLEGLVGESRCTVCVYEGMPHSTAGAEIRDLCAWLEEVLPET